LLISSTHAHDTLGGGGTGTLVIHTAGQLTFGLTIDSTETITDTGTLTPLVRAGQQTSDSSGTEGGAHQCQPRLAVWQRESGSANPQQLNLPSTIRPRRRPHNSS
jgi:hypothetical protein